jgi:hypothetical protein
MTQPNKVSPRWRVVAIGAILIAVVGCGPAAKLRRAQKLIAKAEMLGAKWHTDTVWKDTYHYIPRVERDSVFLNVPGDTVVIEKERLRVKVKVNHDSIYVKGECLPDTVEVKVPVVVNKSIEAPQKITWWEAVLGVLLAFVIGYGVCWITKKR